LKLKPNVIVPAQAAAPHTLTVQMGNTNWGTAMFIHSRVCENNLNHYKSNSFISI